MHVLINCNQAIQQQHHYFKSLFINKPEMLSSISQTANTPPRRIVDFRVTNQHQIFYLAVWDDNARIQEWVQDTHLVGCERLIQEFFTSIQAEEEVDSQYEEGITRSKKLGQLPAPYITKWNFDNSKISKLIKKKYGQRKSTRRGGKKKSKKYVDEEARRITEKIEQLESFIQKQNKNKLDYLLNFVTNVFKKDGVPYCTVRTLPPERNLVISIAHMERYFPQTLKDYYITLLKLHNRKMSKRGGALSSSDEESASRSNPHGDRDDFDSQNSESASNQNEDQLSQEMMIE